jgi:hypothetical protein
MLLIVIFFLNPELNNANRFLRGGDGSQTAEYMYQEDALQQHVHDYNDKSKEEIITNIWNDGKYC